MMNITQMIQTTINKLTPGQIFGYGDLPHYAESPSAVIKAVNRMVADNKISRISKGKFYTSKKGLLGNRKPTDSALISSVLYKNGRLFGYVTGPALYNQLGLTTQVPRVITVAFRGGNQLKDFGTIKIKLAATRLPIEEKNVKLLQYLDVLKGIKKIPDSNINQTLTIMLENIKSLPKSEQSKLISLAKSHYSPQVRALLGLIFSSIKLATPKSLRNTLNPTTVYKLNLDDKQWPEAKEWNIQ